MPDDNADQVCYWNGEVGQRWARDADRLDAAFRPLTDALVRHAAVRPGERVLDVGCGCGDLTGRLAKQAGPGGAVLAVDVSYPMLEHARARTPTAGRAPITWTQADASALPCAEVGYDVLASRFGVMFFADPLAAFRHLRLSLRPGGRLAMLCWRPAADNAWVAVPRAAMLQVVPEPPPTPPLAPGPFAFADAAYTGAMLARAGFTGVSSLAVDARLQVPSMPGGSALEDAVRFVTECGPASGLVRDADEALRGRAVDAVRTAMAGLDGLGAACWLYSAVNPGQAP